MVLLSKPELHSLLFGPLKVLGVVWIHGAVLLLFQLQFLGLIHHLLIDVGVVIRTDVENMGGAELGHRDVPRWICSALSAVILHGV